MNRFPRTATNIIAALTALAFVIAWILGQSQQTAWSLGFIPARFSGFSLPFPVVPAVLTPLTATLAHANLVHVGFNLLILVFCGLQVERVIGGAGLSILYVIGAYAAAAAQFAMNPQYAEPVIGASGAVSAVIGAYALSFGRAKPITSNLRVNRWLNVLWLMVAWVILQMATAWLAGTHGVLLATPAHVGGFVAGLLLQRPLLLWRYRKA
jgi:membrane associated rhomboid family serine protease